MVMPWTVDEVLRVRGAIDTGFSGLAGCKVDLLYKGAPSHYQGCWAVVSLSQPIFLAVVAQYLAEDGSTPIEQIAKARLLEIVAAVSPDVAA